MILFIFKFIKMNTIDNTSLLIHEETLTYPLTLTSLTQRHPNISFGPMVPASFVNGLGYKKVTRTARPNGQVVEELKPVLTNGEYFQTFSSRDYNAQEINEQLVEKRNVLFNLFQQQYEKILSDGFEFIVNGEKFYLNLEQSNQSNILLHLELAKIKINTGDDTPIGVMFSNNNFLKIQPIEAIELFESAIIKINKITMLLWEEKEKIMKITNKEDINLNLTIIF